MSGDERVGCNLTHYLAIPGMSPASAMFRFVLRNGTEWTGEGRELVGVVDIVDSRMSTFIVPRMLES
jgi:hypothetical protein